MVFAWFSHGFLRFAPCPIFPYGFPMKSHFVLHVTCVVHAAFTPDLMQKVVTGVDQRERELIM